MAFPDYPFSTCLKSFIRHEEVLDYLEGYASHYDLLKYIKFETSVQRLHPISGEDKTTWELTYNEVKNKSLTSTENFDAVIVCNGHYTLPLIPKIQGIEDFKGDIVHSHSYRHPEDFSGKVVLCLGAAASGQDISVDVAACAKQVYLCHRNKELETVLPQNVSQTPGIKYLTANQAVLENSEVLNIDVLLLCTGYRYYFPFLTEACKLHIEDERVTPLYKHLIHTEYPTLSFIGIPKTICPFPLFDIQIRFVLSALSGKMKLPTKEEMENDIKLDFEKRLNLGFPHRKAHHMGSLQWAYNDDLAEMSGEKPMPRVVQKLYDEVHRYRVLNVVTYKSLNYKLLDSENFTAVET